MKKYFSLLLVAMIMLIGAYSDSKNSTNPTFLDFLDLKNQDFVLLIESGFFPERDEFGHFTGNSYTHMIYPYVGQEDPFEVDFDLIALKINGESIDKTRLTYYYLDLNHGETYHFEFTINHTTYSQRIKTAYPMEITNSPGDFEKDKDFEVKWFLEKNNLNQSFDLTAYSNQEDRSDDNYFYYTQYISPNRRSYTLKSGSVPEGYGDNAFISVSSYNYKIDRNLVFISRSWISNYDEWGKNNTETEQHRKQSIVNILNQIR